MLSSTTAVNMRGLGLAHLLVEVVEALVANRTDISTIEMDLVGSVLVLAIDGVFEDFLGQGDREVHLRRKIRRSSIKISSSKSPVS